IALKTATGSAAVAALERESLFYIEHLGSLQGEVVPKHYGFFKGTKDGVEFACMSLEYCTGSWDAVNFNGQIMLAACKLHSSGILHGDLVNSIRHIVPYRSNGVRIIDFSNARAH
ncbi:hypothetical protein K435DRAFT_607960, partial [Dendrothele bispora CBS 962.96]